MGRPPTPVGTWGKITVKPKPARGYIARARFRDFDGRPRLVERAGRTKAAAEQALKLALRDRQAPAGEEVSGDMRMTALIDLWLADVDSSALHTGTKQHYHYVADSYVRPGIGELRVSEVRTGTVDRLLKAVALSSGPSSAKSCRSVLSGVMKLAAQRDAISGNPVRDVAAIRQRRKPAQSLTIEQTADLRGKLRESSRAVELDLPDLVDFMLETGCRIGEACAARYATNAEGNALLDLDNGTWEVNATVIRVRGQGLTIQEWTKSNAGWRVLALPRSAVEMLRRRAGEVRLQGPHRVVFGSPKAKQLRDPSNTPGDLREVLDAAGYGWVTSHTFRKTVATRLDEAGLSSREVANQLGHAQPSMTQDRYMGRQVMSVRAATVLNAMPAHPSGTAPGERRTLRRVE